MKLFVIKLSINNAEVACENYLNHAKKRIKEQRIKMIRELTAPRPNKFLGLIKQKPICQDVKSAIRYMKTRYSYISGITFWKTAEMKAVSSRSYHAARQLRCAIRSNCLIGQVLLDEETAFLVSYIDYR